MALSQREKNIAMATGGVVGLLGLYMVVWTPYWEARTASVAQRERVQAKLDDAKRTFDKKDRMRKIWDEMLDHGLKATPPEADGTLLAAVRDWAHNSDIRSISVKPERNSQDKLFQTIGYRASGPGPLKSASQFLWQLETSTIPVKVTELNITPRREGTDDLNVTIAVSTLCLLPDGADKDRR